MKRRLLGVLVALALFGVSGRSYSVRAASALPGLSVSGTQIVADGVPVRLRGVNMGDPFWARNPDWYPLFSLNDYNILAHTWHANIVRISIFPTQWKHMDHTQLLDGLASQVDAALSNDMYVIISYHVIGWPDGYYQAAYPGNPSDTYDSSMALATSFWAQMAQAYGGDTRIIFDLWNEPVYPTDMTTGPADPNPLWPTLKTYYESLIKTVRDNHAQNIVIATGNCWASWLVGIKDSPLADANVVYAYHKYSVPGQNSASVWNTDTGGLIGVKPVIVSEWGYEDSDAGSNPQWPGTASNYGTPFTTWLEDNQLSNLSWMYHYDWTPAMLKSDGSLTLYGAFAENYIDSHNAPTTTVAFTSTGPQDGSVLESRENSSAGGVINAGGLRLGDDARDRQYRSLLSFDTSGLPDNAAITLIKLKIKRSGATGGDPFYTLGNIKADILDGAFTGDPALQSDDFNAASSQNGALTIGSKPVHGWYSKSMSSAYFVYINLTGLTQFRLRFARGDNDNGIADTLRFYGGDAASPGYRPTLIVQYYLP